MADAAEGPHDPASAPVPVQLPPPGWYVDPAGGAAVRWWDGGRWTEHTNPGWVVARAAVVPSGAGAVPLASWWPRVGGYVLDGLIVGVPVFLLELATGVLRFGTRQVVLNGTTRSTGAVLMEGSTLHQVVVHLVTAVAALAYSYLLLSRRGQTVGMMAAGVRAVDRATVGPLGRRQTARRVLALFLIASVWGVIAFGVDVAHHARTPLPAATLLTGLGGLLLIVSSLWALGNPHNQTWQDKAAGTIVVRARH